MSTTDDTGSPETANLPALEASPDHGSSQLDRAYDDAENPSTLTVFPADAEWPEIGTTWISVDVDHARDLDEWR